MDIENKYNFWLKLTRNSPELHNDLLEIHNNEVEKFDRFYKDLEFGTAGIRGIMGAGTNRINDFIIKKITQGFANYLNKNFKNPSVAISFDSRWNSKKYAKKTAEVFAANGVQVYISRELEPTPFLSYAVRNLNCSGGVMITASHNPAEYNGYKCYGSDGAQISVQLSQKIFSEISKINIEKDVKIVNFNKMLDENQICYIPEKTYEGYLSNVQNQQINKIKDNLVVTFTPLNGSGNKLIRKILKSIGIINLNIVPEQKNPDGNFTTCPNPNPEIIEAFDLALKVAKQSNSDIIIATDPDCDRIGVGVKNNGEYKILSGNQIGILLFNYIITHKKLHSFHKPIVIKTVVSTKMVNQIAQKHGCEVIEVLTGFKNIGEKIRQLEQKNQENRFVFGFEESHGYLAGTYARDKDAVLAAMLVCEMASYYKTLGFTLIQQMENLYNEYGFYYEKTLSYELETKKIENIMKGFKTNLLRNICGFNIIDIKNHSNDLEKTEMIEFNLENNHTLIIRPSGTEPKIKFYLTGKCENRKDCENVIKEMEKHILQFLV